MINKLITLDNNEKHLILTNTIIEKTKFLIGIKVENNKYINEFKIFIDKSKNDEILLEEIKDDDLIKVIVNSFILDNLHNVK